MDIVPASTRIRIRSVRHVETERLLGRLEYLRTYITLAREWAEQKSDFRAKVREIVAIENELTKRQIAHNPVTRRSS